MMNRYRCWCFTCKYYRLISAVKVAPEPFKRIPSYMVSGLQSWSRMTWSTVSNEALKSRSANTVTSPAIISDTTLVSAVSVKQLWRCADCTSGSVPILSKCICIFIHSHTSLSNIFDTIKHLLNENYKIISIKSFFPNQRSYNGLFNPLTPLSGDPAIIFCNMAPISSGSASVQLDLWRQYPGARLERYLHYGAVMQMLGFTHRHSV